ncbi:MAG: T9SS type A sorting domain-containing protein [Bacteroidota bacterium]
MLSSFKCDGTYRWSKTFGGYENDEGRSLKVDTLGHVYTNLYSVSPPTSANTRVHIDVDSILPVNDPKTMFLVEYDTAGTFIKVHAPQPDTITVNSNNSWGIDVDVDNAGNVYWFCHFSPGLLGDGVGQVITTDSFYILKYNSSGVVVGIIPINIMGLGNQGKMTRDPLTGRFYFVGTLVGSPSFSIGGNPITHSMYIGAFSSTGQFIWKKENSNKESELIGRVCVGNNGSIYFTGNLNGLIGSSVDTISNIPFTFSAYGGPFVMNLDSNGNNIWNKVATAKYESKGYGLALRNNTEVVMVGSYAGKVVWPGFADSLSLAINTLADIFITRFNAQTGAVIGVDTLASNFGYPEYPSSIVADKSSNVYIGGEFPSALYVANDTLITAGGESDFFIAKYGSANCSTQSVENLPLTSTEIRIYPNPTNDVLHIDNLKDVSTYQVINIIGTTVQQGRLQAGSNSISTQLLASGMYIVELVNNKGEKEVLRVVKE